MQEVQFPCGSKGAANFCPSLCQFGKFCKVKDKMKQQKPRGLTPEQNHPEQETPDEDVKIEMYY